jgi:hypothetical protein
VAVAGIRAVWVGRTVAEGLRAVGGLFGSGDGISVGRSVGTTGSSTALHALRIITRHSAQQGIQQRGFSKHRLDTIDAVTRSADAELAS